MHTVIRALFTLLLIASPNLAFASKNVMLSGTVGAADSTCNAEVTPWAFPVADETVLEVRLVVSPGTTIAGWSCNGGVCSRRFGPADLGEDGMRLELLKIVDADDPEQTVGATILLADPDVLPISLPFSFPPPAPAKGYVPAPPVCCACPCEFAETCT
jgi:hypothetical protein